MEAGLNSSGCSLAVARWIAVVREIKQHGPDIAILFFSIYDTKEILEEARSMGDGFIIEGKKL
jgi:hypothetical protein